MYHGKIFQLPCPYTSKNDDNWIIFPVYCATAVDVKQEAMPSSQFGFPIVLAIEANKCESMDFLYEIIAHHIERYCIVKLFEEDATYMAQTDNYGNLLEHKEKEDATTESDDTKKDVVQQPIHTTAAVTPAGGGPMIAMPNLFHIKVFSQQKSASISKSLLHFPTGSSINWKPELRDDSIVLKQGQGVVLEWSVSRAQQVFGIATISQAIDEHDHHSEINTEAWSEYEELRSTSAMIKKSTMTTRSSLISSQESCTLEDCLNEFTGDEKLSNEDLWYCPRCERHQRASKKFDIWKLPEILVVHLKRFSQVRRWGNKIDSKIDFPITGLDMTDHVLSSSGLGEGENGRLVYDLYAVDNHYGGMGGGHCKYINERGVFIVSY
jgi:hypothetical protein